MHTLRVRPLYAALLVLVAIVSFVGSELAFGLTSWSDWVTAQPYVSKQIPPYALIVRGTGTNAYYVMEADPTTGALPVAATIDLTAESATGAAVPAQALFVGGTDGTDLRGLKTDTGGELQVDVLSSALPSGASTAANQTTANTSLSSIDGKLDEGQETMANSLAVVVASDQSAIPASQSGTWNITDVSGTVSLPTGAATAAKQPALGTAGTPSADVITVQGASSMTPIQINPYTTVVTDTATSSNDDVFPALDVSQYAEASLHIEDGGATGYNIQAQFSNNNVNWYEVSTNDLLAPGATPSESMSSDGMYTIPIKGRYLRIRATSYSSGTITGVTVLSTIPRQDNLSRFVGSSSFTITLPSGASTAAHQVTQNTHLSNIATNTTGVSTAANQTTSNGLLTTIDADTGNIATSTATIAGAVSGSEMQVDIASAIPAGNNNIGDVDVTNLPSTVATNAGANDSSTLRVSEGSRSYSDSARLAYSSSNVTSGAWVELDASTAAAINAITVFHSCGDAVELGTGAAAAEARVLLIPPGGFDFIIPLRIESGTRLSLRAIGTTCSAGEIDVTGFQ